MNRRSFLKGIGLLGLATALGVKSVTAQDESKIDITLLGAAVEEEQRRKRAQEPNNSKILTEKFSIDYLVEAFVPSVIYSHSTNKLPVYVDTSKNDASGAFSEFSIDRKFTLKSNSNLDASTRNIEGYTCDSSNGFNFRIIGISKESEKGRYFKNMSTIKFQGILANKDITYTLFKNGELPTRIEGVWNNLDIIVTYTPSSSVKWLVDKADVTLRDITTKKLVAQYLIEYQQGERKVQEGTAIGYKGFTVTKK